MAKALGGKFPFKPPWVALGAAALGAYVVGRGASKWWGYSLVGKVVLITGGSRGLGMELARAFARRGARVALLARDLAELERARAQLEGEGVATHIFTADVTNSQSILSALEKLASQLGGLDVLVNNAGQIQVGPFEQMTEADFDNAMSVHFRGPLKAILAALPQLRKTRGRIVNIASIGGKLSVPHLLPYSASKFALVGLSEGLRTELAQDGIRVTTVCPGLMRTGSPRQATLKGNEEQELFWFRTADSLPGLSMNAQRAAEQIVKACIRGDAELIVGWPAKLAAKTQALFPEWVATAMETVNRWLPSSTQNGEGATPLPAWLRERELAAAARNNEVGGPF